MCNWLDLVRFTTTRWKNFRFDGKNVSKRGDLVEKVFSIIWLLWKKCGKRIPIYIWFTYVSRMTFPSRNCNLCWKYFVNDPRFYCIFVYPSCFEFSSNMSRVSSALMYLFWFKFVIKQTHISSSWGGKFSNTRDCVIPPLARANV